MEVNVSALTVVLLVTHTAALLVGMAFACYVAGADMIRHPDWWLTRIDVERKKRSAAKTSH